MASTLDNLPQELQSLQLLIDQFRDAEDWEERDEVLADIIAHETEEALVFLRLIADNQAEDVYTRCDAICAVALRTSGAERLPDLLAYLDDQESTYEFCRAADAAAALGVKDAAPPLWRAWERDLDDEALHATLAALEAIVPEETAERFTTAIEAEDAPGKIDIVRLDLMLKTIANLKPAAQRARLEAWEAKLREHLKQRPDDDGQLEDAVALAREALRAFDEGSEEE